MFGDSLNINKNNKNNYGDISNKLKNIFKKRLQKSFEPKNSPQNIAEDKKQEGSVLLPEIASPRGSAKIKFQHNSKIMQELNTLLCSLNLQENKKRNRY